MAEPLSDSALWVVPFHPSRLSFTLCSYSSPTLELPLASQPPPPPPPYRFPGHRYRPFCPPPPTHTSSSRTRSSIWLAVIKRTSRRHVSTDRGGKGGRVIIDKTTIASVDKELEIIQRFELDG